MTAGLPPRPPPTGGNSAVKIILAVCGGLAMLMVGCAALIAAGSQAPVAPPTETPSSDSTREDDRRAERREQAEEDRVAREREAEARKRKEQAKRLREAQARRERAERARANPTVPNLVGERLDVAEDDLRRKGLRFREVGGGAFGIINASAWVVCSMSPSPGGQVKRGTRVRLVVEREGSC